MGSIDIGEENGVSKVFVLAVIVALVGFVVFVAKVSRKSELQLLRTKQDELDQNKF